MPTPDILQTLNSFFITNIPGGFYVWTILMFIIVLGLLVFVHEYGHYWAARRVGAKVEAFSIGFGPELFGWNDKHGTRWKLSLIPLGGYVAIYGQGERVENMPKNSSPFEALPVWRRAVVVAAGPFANFLFAVVIMACLMLAGEQKLLSQVGEVLPEKPAAVGGLLAGDIIQSVADIPTPAFEDLQQAINARPGQPSNFVVQRGNDILTLTITPQLQEYTDMLGRTKQVGMIGIKPAYTTFLVQHSVPQALLLGVTKCWDMTITMLEALWRLATRSLSADNVGGPIMIAEMAGKSGEAGFYALFMFMVVISLNLGLINLLPVPVLDGGHLVYYTAEAVRGKPLSARVQEFGQRVGLAFIALLMCLAFYNDIMRVVARLT